VGNVCLDKRQHLRDDAIFDALGEQAQATSRRARTRKRVVVELGALMQQPLKQKRRQNRRRVRSKVLQFSFGAKPALKTII